MSERRYVEQGTFKLACEPYSLSNDIFEKCEWKLRSEDDWSSEDIVNTIDASVHDTIEVKLEFHGTLADDYANKEVSILIYDTVSHWKETTVSVSNVLETGQLIHQINLFANNTHKANFSLVLVLHEPQSFQRLAEKVFRSQSEKSGVWETIWKKQKDFVREFPCQHGDAALYGVHWLSRDFENTDAIDLLEIWVNESYRVDYENVSDDKKWAAAQAKDVLFQVLCAILNDVSEAPLKGAGASYWAYQLVKKQLGESEAKSLLHTTKDASFYSKIAACTQSMAGVKSGLLGGK
jgi:hypothetical protein